MPFGWLSYFNPHEFDERPGRRLANRPRRGARTKVKAARKASHRSTKRG